MPLRIELLNQPGIEILPVVRVDIECRLNRRPIGVEMIRQRRLNDRIPIGCNRIIKREQTDLRRIGGVKPTGRQRRHGNVRSRHTDRGADATHRNFQRPDSGEIHLAIIR